MNTLSTARLLSLMAAGGLFLSGLNKRNKAGMAWAIGGALILAGLSLAGGARLPASGKRWGTLSDDDALDDALAGTFPASDPPAFQVPESVPAR